MKKAKVKNIANTRFGLNAKTNDRDGILCIQGKDLKDNRLEVAGNMYIEPKDCSAKDFLQPGDVLFSAKGNRHIAAVWDKQEKAVASSSFLILSINKQEVLPEYLAWYLNQPKTQNYLKQFKKGGTVTVISKKDFEQIDVDIPSIEIQKKIIRIVNLEFHEHKLMDELKAKRKLLVRGITNKIFQK
jgi:restriction endonuclease S subunit